MMVPPPPAPHGLYDDGTTSRPWIYGPVNIWLVVVCGLAGSSGGNHGITMKLPPSRSHATKSSGVSVTPPTRRWVGTEIGRRKSSCCSGTTWSLHGHCTSMDRALSSQVSIPPPKPLKKTPSIKYHHQHTGSGVSVTPPALDGLAPTSRPPQQQHQRAVKKITPTRRLLGVSVTPPAKDRRDRQHPTPPSARSD